MANGQQDGSRGQLMELAELHKRFGEVHALQGVTLTVPHGSIGLLGPNGAGKSTLFKIMLGLVAPDEGSVQVLDFDAARRSLELRQRIGYMPEMDSYLAGLDAVELCTFAGELCGLPTGEARQRANQVLSYVGLGDKRYLKVSTYSTGQKQRVKLAQALVHDPELLLLDEPTNGLDPEGREEMLALIRQLPERRGCSIILSSHLLPDVEAVCQEVVVLDGGQVRYSGSLEALRGKDENRFEVEVKSGSEELAVRLRAKGCQTQRALNRLQVTLPSDADADLIFAQALEAKLQVRHLAPLKLTLEAAFLDVLAEGRNGADASAGGA
jgi:ABC-2 type transport system ATP-binding protein